MKSSGKQSDPLACRVLWKDHALLCFRVWEKDRRRWVTEADLKAWSTTTADLGAAVAGSAAKVLTERVEKVPVDGSEATYLRLRDGDGWAASGVLAPHVLAKRLGVPYLAAIPAEGVFVAWKHGTPELDHIMAVGVREMHDEQDGGVSPYIYAWDGAKWTPFGEAKPSVATPEPPH